MSASLDSTLDPMEEIRFRKNTAEFEVMLIFFKIMKRDDKASQDMICRNHYRDVLHTGLNMTDSLMMERAMVALDRGTSPYVTMATFAKGMSLFMRGTLEEKIQYCFTCYDLMSESMLRRETMYQLMKKSLVKASHDDDVEESVKELVDILLNRMDIDLDGSISFEDYRATVLKTPQLLEVLGMCLPERSSLYAFIGTWCQNWGKM